MGNKKTSENIICLFIFKKTTQTANPVGIEVMALVLSKKLYTQFICSLIIQASRSFLPLKRSPAVSVSIGTKLPPAGTICSC